MSVALGAADGMATIALKLWNLGTTPKQEKTLFFAIAPPLVERAR